MGMCFICDRTFLFWLDSCVQIRMRGRGRDKSRCTICTVGVITLDNRARWPTNACVCGGALLRKVARRGIGFMIKPKHLRATLRFMEASPVVRAV